MQVVFCQFLTHIIQVASKFVSLDHGPQCDQTLEQKVAKLFPKVDQKSSPSSSYLNRPKRYQIFGLLLLENVEVKIVKKQSNLVPLHSWKQFYFKIRPFQISQFIWNYPPDVKPLTFKYKLAHGALQQKEMNNRIWTLSKLHSS